ncbi:MAG: type II secretion system protein [Tepidisphaerales bacterium]
MRQREDQNIGRDRGAPRAFTTIELLIVITILGILAAIVVPRFSDASPATRENALKDDLRYLRTQVVVFKAQHRDVAPGYPNGNVLAVPSASDFISQMTGRTDELVRVGTAPACNLGPYLPRIPPNPVNGRDTIMVVANGTSLPAADNSTGWIYQPQTLEVVPNCTGVDSEGRRYADY